MNNFFAFFVLSLALFACAASPPVVSSTYEVSRKAIENGPTSDRIKGKIVEGTVWVYDESINGYVWITDEGNKVIIRKTINSINN